MKTNSVSNQKNQNAKIAFKHVSVGQLSFTFVIPVLVLVLMAAAHILYGLNITRMTRDPAVLAGMHPFTGFLSNLGALLWCCTAAICLFTCLILYNFQKRDMLLFFFFSALLSAYLLFDDFFMFHEELGPRYLRLNEKLIVVLLGVTVLTYLIYFRKIIMLQTNCFFLFLSLGLLGTSVAVDSIFYKALSARIGYNWAFFIEDGAKWLGIGAWCSYYVQASYQSITNLSCKPCEGPVQKIG